MPNALKNVLTFRWQPGQDTLVALVTAILMIPIYYTGAHSSSSLVGLLVFVIFGNGILNVLFPAYYLLILRNENPTELGITTHRLWLAALLSIACSAVMWKGLQQEVAKHPDVELLPQLLLNGVILWEPFFVFGWLQLRFERAFGLLPGILLASICFGAYHLGTYPFSGVVGLAIFGIFFAVLFWATKNLLAVWPVTWAVSSSIGTLQGNMHFGWKDVATYAIVFLIQAVAIAWMISHGRKPDSHVVST